MNDIEVALQALPVSTLAIKLGRSGAMARRGTDIAQADILQAKVVDTSGAGDRLTLDSSMGTWQTGYYSAPCALQPCMVPYRLAS